MTYRALRMLGLIASLATLGTGCIQGADAGADEGNPEAVGSAPEEMTVGSGKIQILRQHCNNDGVTIKDGSRYRLSAVVGPDVTGISDPNRVVNGPVCHNTTVWKQAAEYICHENPGGSRNAWINEFDEWVAGVYTAHPGGNGQNGLYLGYAVLDGPCDTPSGLDYALDHIECCSSPPLPNGVPGQ